MCVYMCIYYNLYNIHPLIVLLEREPKKITRDILFKSDIKTFIVILFIIMINSKIRIAEQ